MRDQILSECPIRKTLEVIGGKWQLLIVFQFSSGQPVRYGELKRLIPEISEKVLLHELKNFVDCQILIKKSFPEIPPRVEYSLTAKGKNILPLMKALEEFGMNNM